MKASLRTIGWSVFCLNVISGCASQSTPAHGQEAAASAQHDPAETPTQAPTGAAKPTASAAKGAPAGTEPAHDSSTAAADEVPADGLRKPSRPPAELITGSNVVYVFNFKESAVGAAAQQTCEREAADDPRAVRECVEKARSQVPVESVRFVKDKSNQYWWVTYNRYKGNLLKWHRIQFMPGAETDSTLSLNLIGKDKGIAPLTRLPRSLAINLPNDYSIIIQDPELGAMAYDAKIGLMEAD
jgi:hypothetical protein